MNDYRPIIALAIFCGKRRAGVRRTLCFGRFESLSKKRRGNLSVHQWSRTGYSWVNTDLAFANRRRLFCIPHTLVLTVDQQIDIVDRHLKRIPADGELPVGAVLLAALKEMFPCPNSN